MIIVDTALEAARSGRQADPRRHDRRRLHGAGPDQPDREQHPRGCGWWRSTTATSTGRSPSSSTPARAGRRDHAGALDDAIARGKPVVTEDAMLLARSEQIDVLGRRHRRRRIRRAGDARSVRARQARRADERRARRHDRPDPPGLRRRSTASSCPAATATSPASQMNLVPLGQRPRPDPARDAATSRGSRIATAIRRRRRASPRSGARTRRW